MAAAADLTTLYRIRESPRKLKKTHAGTDGPEFILILAVYKDVTYLRRCGTLCSAREMASMAFSAEQVRHTENVFHIALR